MCDRSVGVTCLQANRFVHVQLPLKVSASSSLYLFKRRINELYSECRRFSYRYIWWLLMREDLCVTHKPVNGIYHFNALGDKRRQHCNRLVAEWLPLSCTDALNLVG